MSPASTRSSARPGRGPVLAAVVLVVLAAAAVLLTRGPAVRPTEAAGTSGDLVTRSVVACPDEDAARDVTATVQVGLAPGPDGERLARAGAVDAGPVGGDTRSVDVSRGASVDVPPDGGPTVVATGGPAAGLFAFRTDRRAGGSLAVAACVAPRAQWWFTGAGAGLDHSSTLLLTNVDPGPAVVDLRVLGPEGDVETVGTTGITVPPESRQRIELADIAPQTDELALEVHADRGRVAASVVDSLRPRPTSSPGQEWVPGTDRAARSVRLAGVPAGASDRTLLVANPSDLEAVVDVRVSGRSGTFAPAGLEPVTVAPGALERVDVDEVLPAGEPVTLRLRSRVPVVASLRTSRDGDHAYAGPVATLGSPAAGPVLGSRDASVQLTAGAAGATADVAAYDRTGRRVDGTVLSMGPGATRSWSPRGAAASVVVTPVRGSVSGAVGYAGDGIAAVPLTALPYRVERPSVRPAVR